MPDENALRRATLRKKAAMRAEFQYNVTLARIDFVLDELEPAIKKLAEDFANGKLKDTTFEPTP